VTGLPTANPLTARPPVAAPAPDRALRSAAEAFEAMFMRQMIGTMRAAKLTDDMLANNASDTFRDMFDARIADSMAEASVAGIAGMLMAEWGKGQ
jgi:flagellar protein FlgJ